MTSYVLYKLDPALSPRTTSPPSLRKTRSGLIRQGR